MATGLCVLGGCAADSPFGIFADSTKNCAEMVLHADIQTVAKTREQRFLGKVPETTARCVGGKRAESLREGPWLDWPNYWAAGDATSLAPARLLSNAKVIGPNAHGINGALYELELQRIELLKFNLFDNNKTYKAYVTGRGGEAGPVLRTWPEMRLPRSHPDFTAVGGDQTQVCRGEFIRFRTLTGICNDIRNPLMGSTHQLFARNVEFDTTFPDLGLNEMTKNRHGDRLSLLKPDPQIISRKLFTRAQVEPKQCNKGYGLPGRAKEAECDYEKAPFFNVLAAFWIQFMTHDWFAHLEEGHNKPEWISVGCATELVENIEKPVTGKEAEKLGCRPGDKIDLAYIAEDTKPETFTQGGETYLTRAPKTTANHVTAWWDASQLYGYDEPSGKRVKRDPKDPAKLLLMPIREEGGEGNKRGYLPIFQSGDPINPEWSGQEATAFPDNWSIGMSFYHNVFAREHNAFVGEFRKQTILTPDADSGLRNPAIPDPIIRYKDVTPDELFEVARLVVAAEIAKIHTIEWTTQLLYNEPLNRGMNANWSGVFANQTVVAEALKEVIRRLDDTHDAKKTNSLYAALAGGPGIFGLGNRVYDGVPLVGLIDPDKEDRWDLKNDDHVNGGVNHFGSPFNFPEEFITVYRLHPMLPDLLEFREWNNEPNVIRHKVPVIETFRGKATEAMQQKGLANWALSMGRQRLGTLTLQNHPQFLQNL
ncbi:MAG: oxygenase, partial [Nitrospirae bacterium]|nr:oxygenase [Nitrospirota bacterium]